MKLRMMMSHRLEHSFGKPRTRCSTDVHIIMTLTCSISNFCAASGAIFSNYMTARRYVIAKNRYRSIEIKTRIAFKKARSGSFNILYYDHFKQINLYASGF